MRLRTQSDGILRGERVAWIRICLVIAYLTASFRFIPSPVGDTATGLITAFAAFAISLRLKSRYFAEVWQIIAIFLLAIAIDLILRRTGLFFYIIWAQVVSSFLIASVVFALSVKEKKFVIVGALAALFLQLLITIFAKDVIVDVGRSLGVVDPFIRYGRSITRYYYLYFNSNAAAYAVYYFMLSTLAINCVEPFKKKNLAILLGGFLLLIFLTGSRGGASLGVLVIVAWLATFRSARFAFVVLGLAFGGAIAVPLYDFVVAIIGMRVESNTARLHALASYIDIIGSNWLFGLGIEDIRERIAIWGLKPSHNFFIELVALFGLFIGISIIVIIFARLVIFQRDPKLRTIGLFSLLPGLFNNTLLTNWGFFPFFFPLLIWCGLVVRHARNDPRIQRLPASPRGALAGA